MIIHNIILLVKFSFRRGTCQDRDQEGRGRGMGWELTHSPTELTANFFVSNIFFAKFLIKPKRKSNLRENTRQLETAQSFITYSENHNRQTSRN